MEAFQRKFEMLSEEMFKLRDHWAIPRNTHMLKHRHRLLGYCAHDCCLQEPAITMSLLIGVSKWRLPLWLWSSYHRYEKIGSSLILLLSKLSRNVIIGAVESRAKEL